MRWGPPCIALALLAVPCACSPSAQQARQESQSATSLPSEDELNRLGEDIFLMCSRPNLSALPAFNIKARPLPDEATALEFASDTFDKVYGRESMQRQQPLRIVRLDYPYADPPGVTRYNGNWVIQSTWNEPAGTKGGTGIMIANPNGEILCLTHGL